MTYILWEIPHTLVEGLFSNEKSWIDIGITDTDYEINDISKGNKKVLEYEKNKIKNYKKFIDENQEYKDSSRYRPFMLQTDGVITKDTRAIISKIIDIKSKKSDEDKSILMGRFKSNLIAKLMKQNAINILQHYIIY